MGISKLSHIYGKGSRNGFAAWLLILALLSMSGAARAGAWVQKKHGYYLKIGANYLNTGDEYDHLGNRKSILQDLEVFENTSYQEFALFSYFEYGLTDNFTVVADAPFKVARSSRTEVSNYFVNGRRDTSFTTVGPGDLKLAGRLALFRTPAVVSLQSGVKIPLGYSTSKDKEGPTLGTGDVDFEGQLLVGQSFHPFPLYFTGGIGYRYRTGVLHDEVFYSIELGVTGRRANFKLSYDGLQNTSTPQDIYGGTIILPLPGGGGAVPLRLFGDQNLSKLNAALLYKLNDRLALDGQVFQMLTGKNIVAGTTFSLGVVLVR